MITYKVRTHTRLLILHDSHTKPDVERIVQVLRWQGRKMGLLDIGYHFVIDRDGHITETRPQALIGTHTRGHDLDSIGLCLIGGLDADGRREDNFTEDQRRSLFDLVRILKGQYQGVSLMGHDELIRSTDVKHRQHHCPACDMGDLRDNYHQYVSYGGLLA